MASTGAGLAITSGLGFLAAIAGISGTAALLRMLTFLARESVGFGSLMLYQLIWLVFFLGLTAAGISLLVAVAKRRRKNLVPGPTLYVMGASLIVNGFFLVTLGNLLLAVTAVGAGAALLLLEHRTETV